ncbi:lysophospholipid acyltransferase family protein [bacterium]|nr:lysophospholipid acyltransferase family protein [candidate division CSSED10-310 bacterium]
MIVKESPVRDLARLVVWYPIRWSIRLLPVQTAFRLFSMLGDLHLWFSRSRLDQLEENFRRGLPSIRPEAMAGILRTYLRNHYLDRLHIFTYPRLRRKTELDGVLVLAGSEHLDRILALGKGAIIALGHFGPIQLPLFAMGMNRYRITQLGLPTAEGLSWIGRHVAFRLRVKYEGMIPARILPADRFLRPLFHTLRNNGVVFMTIDPAGGGQWIGRMIRMPFLNRMVPFPLGPAQLSLKTCAPILPLSIQRLADTRYRCEIHPPLKIQSLHPSPIELTSHLVRWYEDRVLLDPGLWHFWDEFQPGGLLESDQPD